jgi:hypothetical protein
VTNDGGLSVVTAWHETAVNKRDDGIFICMSERVGGILFV